MALVFLLSRNSAAFYLFSYFPLYKPRYMRQSLAYVISRDFNGPFRRLTPVCDIIPTGHVRTSAALTSESSYITLPLNRDLTLKSRHKP